MREVAQEEFEKDIELVIEGEISLKFLVESYETSYTSLHEKILTLQSINPDLYKRYIKKFPYKPKKNPNISSRAIVIEIMKSGANIHTIVKKYEIPRRTVDRRIAAIKKEDPELYSIYKKYRENPKDTINNRLIEQLDYEAVIQSEETPEQVQKKRLREILKEYEGLISGESPMEKEKAARMLGYTPQQISEMRRKIGRIEAEKSFKEKYQVESMPKVPTNIKVPIIGEETEREKE